MIRNGGNIANGTMLFTQVCVIGSGPAGITAAWELQKAGVQVILIEGSRPYANFHERWPNKILLYNGETTGQLAYADRPDGRGWVSSPAKCLGQAEVAGTLRTDGPPCASTRCLATASSDASKERLDEASA